MKPLVRTNLYKRQYGAALITALVFMGILTMLGISAMRSNLLDVKIHNAMKNRLNAFQCAESALRQGELYIEELDVRPSDFELGVPLQSQQEVWSMEDSTIDKLVNLDDSFWLTNGWGDWSLSHTSTEIGCAEQANYIVQSMGGSGTGEAQDLSIEAQTNQQVNGYRITSRSAGVSGKAAVIVQSTYIRQF